MEKMEKISNLEMFKGSPIEVFSGSPTQILSGSATEVFSMNQVLQTIEPDHFFLSKLECLKCILRGKTVVD